MAGFWDWIVVFLSAYQTDPYTYLLIFFIFCVLAAVALPIPIEVFLLIDPTVPFALKAIAMGLGKGTGALGVYYIGLELDNIAHNVARRAWLKRLYELAKASGEKSPFFSILVGSYYFKEHRKKIIKMVKERRRPEGSKGWGWMKWIMNQSEKLIRRYGYYAVFVIMSIPFMLDTVPLYIFSILNKEEGGTLMTERGFVLVNVAAGITRACIIWVIFFTLGIEIFNVPPTS